MNNKVQIWADKDFERNLRKRFPYKSMYQITKELNDVLEKMIYGANINVKRKKR